MASLNVSMPEDMREFVDRRTREEGFSTPTEYVRSLIREDRRRNEREQFAPLLAKWISGRDLTPEEESSLPAGLLDRLQRRLEAFLVEGFDSGGAGELSRERLEAILNRARARAADATKRKT